MNKFKEHISNLKKAESAKILTNVLRVQMIALQTKCVLIIMVVSLVLKNQKDVVHPKLTNVTGTVTPITQQWDFHANVWKMRMAQDNVKFVAKVK